MNRIAWIVAFGLWGCSFDVDSNPGERCGDSGVCPTGLTCHRGFCVGGMGECEEGAIVECYDGDMALVGVGVCRAGERMCNDGTLSACLGQVQPSVETCSGQDDDCDGTVDNIAAMGCDSGMEGLCAAGAPICRDGSEVCVPNVSAASETCDGDDEDCDGNTDEDTSELCYPEPVGCTLGDDGAYTCVGRCAAGQRVCSDGALGMCEGAVVPASDDGCTPVGMTAADDDCDGETDEDCVCVLGETQSCYGGPDGTADVGVCRSGTQTCEMGADGPRFGGCVGEMLPGTETCGNDTVDNDCDGIADNVPTRGETCFDESMEGICRAGTRTCSGGALVCTTPMPRTETCNRLDDNCDGTTDEGFLLQTDRNNCGSCGNVCGTGLECCGGACVNTQTNAAHCNSCGSACGEGRRCCGGGCKNTDTDRLNCGGCGIECGDGLSCCGGDCVDTRADPTNCGGCGATTPTRVCQGANTCCDGVCALPESPACNDCAADCSAMSLFCCGVSCVDRAVDERNCGGCGTTCDAGDVCCGGGCFDNDVLHCGQSCTACAPGDLCCGGACVPDDAANCDACGVTCGGGETCCGDGCFNLNTDPTRCGGCGAPACPGGQICASGHCCPTGFDWCNGACVDIRTSKTNCGRCGNNCGTGVGCGCTAGTCTGFCI